MPISNPKVALIWMVALGTALGWSGPARGATPEFEVFVLPQLTVEGVELPSFASDLNNRGQVAGHSWFTAFRYTPELGMEVIDLGKGAVEAASKINDRGDVLIWDTANRRWYLYRDDTGVDPLKRGLSAKGLKGLSVLDMNNSGDLVGYVYTRARGFPVLYGREDGWMNLASLDPAFETDTSARLINDSGDLVLTISRAPEPGDDPPFGRAQTYVLRGGDTLVELKERGRGVNVPGDLNEAGEVAGLFRDRNGLEQAYLFRSARPELGVGRVAVGEFKQAIAGWITESGTVGGMASKKGRFDSLFWVETRGQGKSAVVKHRKFRKLARAAGSNKLTSIYVEHMNDRVEFVGYVKAGKPRQSIPFFYSRDKGLHAVQAIVDAAGLKLEVEDVIDVNDRGQILVEVRKTNGTQAAAVLTPVE